MQIKLEEAKRAKRQPMPLGEVVIASTPDRQAQRIGHFAKISTSQEDKYVTGQTREEALTKALYYATRVLKATQITFADKDRDALRSQASTAVLTYLA